MACCTTNGAFSTTFGAATCSVVHRHDGSSVVTLCGGHSQKTPVNTRNVSTLVPEWTSLFVFTYPIFFVIILGGYWAGRGVTLGLDANRAGAVPTCASTTSHEAALQTLQYIILYMYSLPPMAQQGGCCTGATGLGCLCNCPSGHSTHVGYRAYRRRNWSKPGAGDPAGADSAECGHCGPSWGPL